MRDTVDEMRRGVTFARTRMLQRLRNRPNGRTVQLTSPALNGGNHLYLWQWAYMQRAEGNRVAVQHVPSMHAWVDEFPVLSELTVASSEVSFWDARELGAHFRFGTDFTAEQSVAFCRDLVTSSISFQRRLDQASSYIGEETCVVNVRRGDYYSDDRFRPRFSLDILHHVTEALDLLRQMGRPTEDLLVVSDDVDWCRHHLGHLSDGLLKTVPDRRGMFDDLAAIASAPTLVLANSTFSYWGSYLARSRNPDAISIAPSHHEITGMGERVAPMFDPQWPRTSFHAVPTDGATGSQIRK